MGYQNDMFAGADSFKRVSFLVCPCSESPVEKQLELPQAQAPCHPLILQRDAQQLAGNPVLTDEER